jgi:DNA-binding MarR family transcriptional regulator
VSTVAFVPRRSPAAAPAPPASAEATELFFAVGAMVKRLRRNPLPEDDGLTAALQGMSPAPRHILALVQVATDGRIGMSDLAERLSVSLATTSQVVSELADWGLVERSTDDADRRRTFVTVTPAHAATIRALVDSRLRPLERTLARLEPDEQHALLRGLAVLTEELDRSIEAAR